MHRLRAEVGCGFFNTKVEWCASPLITLSWTFLSQSYFRLDLNECVSRGNTKSDSVMRAFGAAMRARVDTMVPAWWVTPPSPSVRRPRPFKHQSSWAHRVRSWARLAALWLSSRVDPQPPLEASRTWCSDLKKKVFRVSYHLAPCHAGIRNCHTVYLLHISASFAVYCAHIYWARTSSTAMESRCIPSRNIWPASLFLSVIRPNAIRLRKEVCVPRTEHAVEVL